MNCSRTDPRARYSNVYPNFTVDLSKGIYKRPESRWRKFQRKIGAFFGIKTGKQEQEYELPRQSLEIGRAMEQTDARIAELRVMAENEAKGEKRRKKAQAKGRKGGKLQKKSQKEKEGGGKKEADGHTMEGTEEKEAKEDDKMGENGQAVEGTEKEDGKEDEEEGENGHTVEETARKEVKDDHRELGEQSNA